MRRVLAAAGLVFFAAAASAQTPDSVSGGPSWLEQYRFDVRAKAPDGAWQEGVKPMLLAPLADRFKLSVHKDTRPTPRYTLLPGKAAHTTRGTNRSSLGSSRGRT